MHAILQYITSNILNKSVSSDISNIEQLDGNDSLNKSDYSDFVALPKSQPSSPTANAIPVITTNRTSVPYSVPKRKPYNRITVRRCNKILDAVKLPVVANLNPRSIYNKTNLRP